MKTISVYRAKTKQKKSSETQRSGDHKLGEVENPILPVGVREVPKKRIPKE